MTSSNNTNRNKLLILDFDVNKINLCDLHRYFTSYGPIEWIETFPELKSVVIHFVSYLIVERLVNDRTCCIGTSQLRLRRFRLDQNNWQFDSHTLLLKLDLTNNITNIEFNESNLRSCFQEYQSNITRLDVIDNRNALISFSHYDIVDQILMQSNRYHIDGLPLVFERIMNKSKRRSRWDQQPEQLTTTPILSKRDPVVYKLISHIEYLTQQLREQPNHNRKKIEQLEAEIFILKNENAQLKSKQELVSNKRIEQRLTALEDISNRFMNKSNNQNTENNMVKPAKRRRKTSVNNECCD